MCKYSEILQQNVVLVLGDQVAISPYKHWLASLKEMGIGYCAGKDSSRQ